MFNYMVGIFDNVTQEPIHILVKGDKELIDLLCARPEHHILSSVQNLGECENVNDYITELKKKES